MSTTCDRRRRRAPQDNLEGGRHGFNQEHRRRDPRDRPGRGHGLHRRGRRPLRRPARERALCWRRGGPRHRLRPARAPSPRRVPRGRSCGRAPAGVPVRARRRLHGRREAPRRLALLRQCHAVGGEERHDGGQHQLSPGARASLACGLGRSRVCGGLDPRAHRRAWRRSEAAVRGRHVRRGGARGGLRRGPDVWRRRQGAGRRPAVVPVRHGRLGVQSHEGGLFRDRRLQVRADVHARRAWWRPRFRCW